jgi:hypothetical protein
MGRFRRFWFGGVLFFCSIGEDDASFYQWDHRSFMVCSGVRKRRLRDVRSNMLFAPYGHHVPSWERIQGYFSPTHWGMCLLKTCIIYSLDIRSEYFFARMWKRTSWWARRYAGCPWGRHGWLLVRRDLNKYVRGKKARFLTTRAEATTFSLLRHAPPCTCACESRKTASLEISERLYLTNLATGNPNLDPNRPENEIWILKIQFHFEARFSS